MANDKDSSLISQLARLPDHEAFRFFLNYSSEIQDDATYWSTLGTLWKLCGTVCNQHYWLPLFRSKRRSRQKIMKGAERRAYNRLPKQLRAYREVNNEGEAETAISWTLSKTVAERIFFFGGTRSIISKEFSRDSIFAYFDRRHEQEILILLEARQ